MTFSANVTFGPVGDAELVERVKKTWLAYLPLANPKPPAKCTAVVHRVTKAQGIQGISNLIVIIVFHKDGQPWGVYRWVDGSILPGDGVGPENFGALN